MIEIVVIWPDCLVFICRICFWMNLECKLLSCMWKLQRGFEVCLEVWWKVVIGPSIESSCLSKQLNLIKSFCIFSNIVKLICCCDLLVQATQCSFTGKLDSDPDSTVYISGCPEKEGIDISLMSEKVESLNNLYTHFLDLVLIILGLIYETYMRYI